jgi:hypothetical protein
MKDTHLYQRMNNPTAFKVYMNMIKTYELDIVKELFANLTKDASDHPKYEVLKSAYDSRINT